MKRSTRVSLLVLSVSLGLAIDPALAQTLSVNQPHTGDVVVTGQATPGAGPVTIYVTSLAVPTPVGSGDFMDAAGNFAVSVKPPLGLGGTIVAEDSAGNQSLPVTIVDPVEPAE